ncbi:hypothetical protein H5410_014597 [Solanum commersonii]|uniref:Uncharacterized protein n=1 Tax=Solanum commersonii TaxID=4109 RepID=A0A9J5ZRB3_SOLCO|nr:hypothetical protein H5410_014597 [Solanum commersonii]
MDPNRSWMYNRNNPGRAGMIPEFPEGVTRFINHAKTLDDFLTSRLISFDGGDKETISAMESKIVYLNAELAAVAEREKKREEKERKREEEIAATKKVENKSSDENNKFDKESEGDENGTSDKESESD